MATVTQDIMASNEVQMFKIYVELGLDAGFQIAVIIVVSPSIANVQNPSR